MAPSFDTILVGAGLAGACAAWSLSRHERVLVLDAVGPAAGASGAAAGLVNPLMGVKARRVWRADEALAALHVMLEDSKATALFQNDGLLRPAADARQAQTFREVAQAHAPDTTWLSANAARARFPDLIMHSGALLIRHGGAIRVPDFVDALLATACHRGAEVRTGVQATGWGEDSGAAFVTLADRTERLYARRIVLSLGYDYHRYPTLAALNLHAIKGQTIRVAWPETLPSQKLPPVSGQGYVVPEIDTLVVGTSYERNFTHLDPSAAQTQAILEKAGRMLPALHDASVRSATAGVRVTVPGTRLPMLGPLPGHKRIWVFTGLGSKGLLMAPLLADALPTFFENPEAIPIEVQVQ